MASHDNVRDVDIPQSKIIGLNTSLQEGIVEEGRCKISKFTFHSPAQTATSPNSPMFLDPQMGYGRARKTTGNERGPERVAALKFANWMS